MYGDDLAFNNVMRKAPSLSKR